MNLPINIKDLLEAGTIENERIEYKTGWNPEPILKTMGAFANDFRDLGGGYIIVGVNAENGVPELPPIGLEPEQIDMILRNLNALGNRISPPYFPIADIAVYQGKQILIIWCPGGQNRPYRCPVSLGNNAGRAYYIRRYSNTVVASQYEELELIQLTQRVPFDDRLNHNNTIRDIDLGLIRTYLQAVKSDLFENSATMNFTALLRRMNLVEGPDEQLFPKNVALMFFNKAPDKLFIQTQIDVVHFPDGLGADSFYEKTFKGPLNVMLSEALSYIKGGFVKEKVIKSSLKAEADRVFNYPYNAIEEALCNAVYHRSYEIREPIEVRILPDKMIINSFPGPDRSISNADLISMNIVSRRYRNRRIGEYLKELHLTEGRGTGLPKILSALSENGSLAPIIHTDEDRSYFQLELAVHQSFINKTVQETAHVIAHINAHIESLLVALETESMKMTHLLTKVGISHRTTFRQNYLKPALKLGVIELTHPDNIRHRDQKYTITGLGHMVLRELHEKDKDKSS